MTRILSGIQPSGSLHIGNYLAMMKPMIALQDDNELYCFIVNYHALTSLSDPEKLKKNTMDAAIDFLALGLDPEKANFWIQSDLPEVQELTWILSCNTSLGLLERSHSYKDKIAKGLTPNAGLYTYPVLMAADILLFQAEKVPVGKDQKQHLEITRDIASSFNANFGETFVLPEPVIEDNLAVIPGVDGQKMSKSYDNTICMFEEEKKMRKRIMKIVTDSRGVDEPKDPDKCTVFSLYKLFASDEQIDSLRNAYLAGGMGYGDAKQLLFEVIRDYFKPFKEKRDQLAADPQKVKDIMLMGAAKTRIKARETLSLVREKVGLKYF
ncbi:MAG: tryptophan--tRNA ligase [Spirochaetes bacterium]|nr:tryptophan--tRNA ligase [Spirochaetota bacterium]MBN2771546.1 tryptophan--tRNA ligase [Spirochaetota bacterium]